MTSASWTDQSISFARADAEGTFKPASHGRPELKSDASKVQANDDIGTMAQALMPSEMSLVKNNTASLSVTPKGYQERMQSADMAVPQGTKVHQRLPSPVHPPAAQMSDLSHSLQINDISGTCSHKLVHKSLVVATANQIQTQSGTTWNSNLSALQCCAVPVGAASVIA